MSSIHDKIENFKIFMKWFRAIEERGEYLDESYPAFRKLFVETNGWFNDIFHRWYNFNKRYRAAKTEEHGFLNSLQTEDIKVAAKALHSKGFYIFPKRLDEETLSLLMKFASDTPCILRYDKSDQMSESLLKGVKKEASYLKLGHSEKTNIQFDPDNLVASNYHFDCVDLLANSTIQRILADSGIVNIAQQYFKSQALITDIGMWWTTPFGIGTASSDLAQLYHFDMERIKFIKFFCYLTDVGPDDGPHNFVCGTHKRKPKQLLRDGRFQDSEIASNYDASNIIEVTAPKGTIFVEDTRGFHKATLPTKGCRLILEISLASCPFGPKYPRFPLKIKNQNLEKLHIENPEVFSMFDVAVDASSSINQEALV